MLQHPNIDPVAFSLGPVDVHWYGLMYLAGFAAVWILGRRRTERPWSPLRKEQIEDMVVWGAWGVILGGRLGYVLFYNFPQFLDDPMWALRVWEGGMAFHGGLLGVMLAMWLFATRNNIAPGDLLDFLAPLAPIGLGLGRVGNFIGQELWGRPSDVPWAMVFQADPSGLARHPSQLYQALLEGVLMFAIVYWFSSRQRPRWAVSGLFLICYGSFRFFVEFFRQPDSHIGFDAFGWLTRGQVLSTPMILAGLAMMVVAYKSVENKKAN